MIDLADLANKYKVLAGLLVTIVGGGFALWRWIVDQDWRRVQYAQSLVAEFLKRKHLERL